MKDALTVTTLLAATLVSPLLAQEPQADVIVGDIHNLKSYGEKDDIHAFSVGTTSCNIGSTELKWLERTPEHPVIAQNLYRLRDRRFEQIGMSWLKHGFFALQQRLCSTISHPCRPAADDSHLGVGCSDPYSASLNGRQPNLGPRSQVNAFTGEFPFPFTPPGRVVDLTSRRLLVHGADLDPALNASALYLVEAQYVAADDAVAGNGTNNVSYRPVSFVRRGSGYDIGFVPGQSTTRTKPAIYAWREVDPSVRIFRVEIPGDGICLVALRTQETASRFHTEMAVYNLNSDRAIRAVTLGFPEASGPTNPGFSAPAYHSGEPFSSVPWVPNIDTGNVTWHTKSFEDDPLANAIRWGTLYSYWVDSAAPPTTILLKTFKPGPQPESIQLRAVPADTAGFEIWASLPNEVDLGEMQRGTEFSVPVRICACPSRSIQHFRSSSNAVTVQAERSKTKGEWVLTLHAAEDAEAGPFESIIRLETGLPQDEPLRMRVFGSISERR